MRTDVRFQALKGQLRKLLNSGLPKDLICQILDLKEGTLNLYIKKLKEDEAFPPIKSERELFLDYLKGFTPKDYSAFIEEYLSVNTFRCFFYSAVNQTRIMGFPQFYDDVPEPYRNLIWDMYPELSYGDDVFSQCLTKALMPEFCADKIDQGVLATNLLSNFVNTYSYSKVAPVFDDQVVPLIDQAIESLENPKQALVLDYFYGLKSGVPADIKMTAFLMHLTPSAVRNIKTRAMRLLSLSPRQEIWQGGYLNWEKTTATILAYRGSAKSKESNQFIDGKSNLSWAEFNCSERVKNFLKRCFDIEDLEELSKLSEKQIMKTAGGGKKTVIEVKKLLADNGY